MAKGTYEGRLMCDGYGNLLADESKFVGEKTVTLLDDDGDPILDGSGQPTIVRVPQFKFGKHHGEPVAFHEGSYVFLNSGDESHNDRHHQQFAVIDATTDASEEGQEHHDGVLENDPHYDGAAENATRLKFDADKVAATATGHTAAYKGGDE